MVIKGLRNIGKHLGRSAMTILRLHEKYDDAKLCFPLYPLFTGKGCGWIWVTDTVLVVEWERRMSELSATERRARLKRPRKRRVLRIGETREGITAAKENTPLRAREPLASYRRPARSLSTEGLQGGGSPTLPVARGCTCGTPIPCTAH